MSVILRRSPFYMRGLVPSRSMDGISVQARRRRIVILYIELCIQRNNRQARRRPCCQEYWKVNWIGETSFIEGLIYLYMHTYYK